MALILASTLCLGAAVEVSFFPRSTNPFNAQIDCTRYTQYDTCDQDAGCNWCGIKGCITDCHYKCYSLDDANHLKNGQCDKPTAPTPPPVPTPPPAPTPAPVPTPPPPTPPPSPPHYGTV